MEREAVICLAVTYVIKEGREADAVALLRELAPASRAEPGCRMYLVHRSTDDPRRFFLYEQYDDMAALDAHRASSHFSEYVTGGLFAILESRSPELFEPIDD